MGAATDKSPVVGTNPGFAVSTNSPIPLNVISSRRSHLKLPLKSARPSAKIRGIDVARSKRLLVKAIIEGFILVFYVFARLIFIWKKLLWERKKRMNEQVKI